MTQWNDITPLHFTMSEDVRQPESCCALTVTFDLSELLQGFSEEFLLHLRDSLIEWRSQVKLKTLEKYGENLQLLFRAVIKQNLFDAKIEIIDEPFLLALGTMAEGMTLSQLRTLKSLFQTTPESPLWAANLHAECFPLLNDKKGAHGRQISRILAKALTRSACVHILSRCEQAYDTGEMDIGLFSFVHLAFAVFCRPESYRQIQLGDLMFDEESYAYFLDILPAKTGVLNPKKISYKLNEPLGLLLQKQRQHVVSQYSHLVEREDIDKLALFPARKLNAKKTAWTHKYANKYSGMYETAESFCSGYPKQIKKLFLSKGLTIGANALRHTVGTQLAQTGASSRTIQAVLKHATDNVCKAYVDIAFHGLIETLSDAMQPAFETHLPAFTRFRSKNDPVDREQAIRSEDLETGKIELTGECGKIIRCEYAPITCYGCVRFIPCWDANHGVNIAIVEREIEDYKRRGTPFQHRLESAQTAKYQIILVMNAADRYREACTSEAQP